MKLICIITALTLASIAIALEFTEGDNLYKQLAIGEFAFICLSPVLSGVCDSDSAAPLPMKRLPMRWERHAEEIRAKRQASNQGE